VLPVSFAASSAGGQVAAASTPIVVSFPIVSNASSSYSATTSAFSAPVSGNYLFSTSINWTTVATAATATVSFYTQVGTATAVLQSSQALTVAAAGTYQVSIPSSLIYLAAGTILFVQFSSTAAATINAGSTFAGNSCSC